MAIDFQQVYQKIREIGASAQQRKKTLEERRAHARFLLNLNADNLEVLRRKLEAVKEVDPAIRCAAPLNERLDFHTLPPEAPLNAVLIAADGSQIYPDRNISVQYCLINVGGIVMELNSGKVTDLKTSSELLLEDEWEEIYGPATEGMIALHRDFKERSALENLSESYSSPIITFTDGPMELWEPKGFDEAKAFNKLLSQYLAVLSRLQKNGIITAGYIEKPSENLFIRLLELAEAPLGDAGFNLREYHPLRGVSDRWLFGEKRDPLLKPGERSAVFAIQSKSEKYYKNVLSLHFFYLNVGTDGHPWPVRVEVPRWVVDDPEKLDTLHAILVEQCRILGVKPYPYLLHRAHETAVVSNEEKDHIRQMLELEIRRATGELDEGSNKQSAKDLPGRTKY